MARLMFGHMKAGIAMAHAAVFAVTMSVLIVIPTLQMMSLASCIMSARNVDERSNAKNPIATVEQKWIWRPTMSVRENALYYLKRELNNAKRSFDRAIERPNVTAVELSNLNTKIDSLEWLVILATNAKEEAA